MYHWSQKIKLEGGGCSRGHLIHVNSTKEKLNVKTMFRMLAVTGPLSITHDYSTRSKAKISEIQDQINIVMVSSEMNRFPSWWDVARFQHFIYEERFESLWCNCASTYRPPFNDIKRVTKVLGSAVGVCSLWLIVIDFCVQVSLI